MKFLIWILRHKRKQIILQNLSIQILKVSEGQMDELKEKYLEGDIL